MSDMIETFITKYREYAEAHGKATRSGNYNEANRCYDKLIVLVPRIRALGNQGELALLELVDDSDDAVACWAATHSLRFCESRAIAVLSELSKKEGPIGFDAKMVIRQWKNGELNT
jgi:hypothetical protein